MSRSSLTCPRLHRSLAKLSSFAPFFASLVGVALLSVSTVPRATAADAAVEFELCTERGISPLAAQEWLTALKNLGLANLRIRSATAADRPEISTKQAGRETVHRVVGIITAQGVLKVPNGSFTTSDVRRIKQWIEKLKAGGEEELTAKPGVFGLSSKQLVELHEALAAPVKAPTAGQPPSVVVRRIESSILAPLAIDAAAGKRIEDGEPVADELQGIAAGTALAAVLRPLGLVLVPQRDGAKARLNVVDVRKSDQSWPVGWPNEEQLEKVVPSLFKVLEVEVNDTPLGDALAAFQPRVKLPVLLDHNSLARKRVDPASTNVKVAKGRMTYARAFDRMLFPLKLSWEVRVDEAGAPLVWVSAGSP
ncbi:MAG TPA: hypothetical protein PLV92_21780 [Pirellulaceae bacterium]|nr:hypothetical protein [Pirellulaceae bacterium]